MSEWNVKTAGLRLFAPYFSRTGAVVAKYEVTTFQCSINWEVDWLRVRQTMVTSSEDVNYTPNTPAAIECNELPLLSNVKASECESHPNELTGSW